MVQLRDAWFEPASLWSSSLCLTVWISVLMSVHMYIYMYVYIYVKLWFLQLQCNFRYLSIWIRSSNLTKSYYQLFFLPYFLAQTQSSFSLFHRMSQVRSQSFNSIQVRSKLTVLAVVKVRKRDRASSNKLCDFNYCLWVLFKAL